MSRKAVPYPPPDYEISDAPLRNHRLLTLFLWLCAIGISSFLLFQAQSLDSFVALLSSAAIVATLGSAICTAGSAFERDLVERVHLDLDIFHRDLIEENVPWRRWPFLRRRQRVKLLNGDETEGVLYNPRLKFDVGTHVIEVDLPSVFEDFFDLPTMRNACRMLWYKKAAMTTLITRDQDMQHAKTEMKPGQERMTYLCVLDIWLAIVKFRFCRYAVHFGTALTISTVLLTAFLVPRVSG
jgi:hypothetical protein